MIPAAGAHPGEKEFHIFTQYDYRGGSALSLQIGKRLSEDPDEQKSYL